MLCFLPHGVRCFLFGFGHEFWGLQRFLAWYLTFFKKCLMIMGKEWLGVST
nr:MAG TPA: hypothetical protein [Caudoviricetes sp.]